MASDIFSKIYLFKEMTDEELEKIQSISSTEAYPAGDTIFSQEDAATSLYIIKYGSVRISQKTSSGDEVEISVLGTGSHFGEMAFLDSEARSATAVAVETTDIVKIDYSTLNTLLEENPEIAIKYYKSLSHFLCGRLRTTTLDLSFAREVNLRHF